MSDKTRPLQVALYVGELPTTTFIDRLSVNLAVEGISVLLVGKLRGSYRSPHNRIQLCAHRPGLFGRVLFLWQYIRLRIFFSSRYYIVKKSLRGSPFVDKKLFSQWQRVVPVLINLPDIFHVQWARHVEDWVWLKQFGIKLIVSLRGAHINYSPLADEVLASMYKKVLPQYDGFHAVSNAIAQEGVKWGVAEKRTKVIYSGISVGRLPEFKTLNKREHTRLLVVGRMHWKKGYHYLFDALALSKEKDLILTLTLVASGDMPEELVYQLHSLGLTKTVQWTKGLPHEEVLLLMQQHDVLILPSVEEGIANVVLEAMSVGLPVISTDCGGMREVIDSGRNGFLVPVRNPKALADAIEFFSTLEPFQVEAIRKNAFYTITNKFDQVKTAKQFVDFYSQVMTCT